MFVPARNGSQSCTLPPVVNYGGKTFCKSHSKTSQAIKIKQAHEKELKDQEEAQEKEKEQLLKSEEERLQKEREADRLRKEAEEKRFEEMKKNLEEKEAKIMEEQERIARKMAELETLKIFKFKEEVLTIGSTLSVNSWGRYEDPESNFVFKQKKCYGRQLENGRVASLTEKDIKILRKNRVPYIGDSDDETSDSEEVDEEVSDNEVDEEVLEEEEQAYSSEEEAVEEEEEVFEEVDSDAESSDQE